MVKFKFRIDRYKNLRNYKFHVLRTLTTLKLRFVDFSSFNPLPREISKIILVEQLDSFNLVQP